MGPRTSRPIPVHLDVIPFTIESSLGNLDWLACSQCPAHLSLHQPDPDLPARMLGICEQCRRWHLILIDQDRKSAMVVILPESQWLQDAWESNKVPDELTEASGPSEEGRLKIHDVRLIEKSG